MNESMNEAPATADRLAELQAAFEVFTGATSVLEQQYRALQSHVQALRDELEATPEELSDSAAAIKRSLAQAAAGQTRDADAALVELEARCTS